MRRATERGKMLPFALEEALVYQGIGENADGQETVRTACEILSVLWQEVGAKNFTEWVSRIYLLVQSKKVLQCSMPEQSEDKGTAGTSPKNIEWSKAQSKCSLSSIILCGLWEGLQDGCSSPRWERVQQLTREFSEIVQKLPCGATHTPTILYCLRKTSKGLSALHTSLSTIQSMENKGTSNPAENCGDSAEGERAREEVARGTGKSVDSAVVRMRSGCAGGGKVPLVSNEKSLTLANGNDLPVVHSYCIAGNTIDRKPQNGGNGTGNQEELSYTLNTVDRHAVAECFPQNAYNKFLQGTPLTTLKACGGSCGGGSENLIVNISPSVGKVRRLTPTECERLQGLPDGFTDIEFKGKPALDSKRYKALGNGMAQPCADYVIKQIVRFVKGL